MSDDYQRQVISMKGWAVALAVLAVGFVLYKYVQTRNNTIGPGTGSRAKIVANNLQLLAHSAQQYMKIHHVTQVRYEDLVGTGSEKLLQYFSPVAGEDYSNLVFSPGTTQLTVSSLAVGTVTFSL